MERGLLQMPAELLQAVAIATYNNGNDLATSLLPLSLTCRRLRDIALAVLFEEITLETSQGGELPWNYRGNINELATEDFLKHVKVLKLVHWKRYADCHYGLKRQHEDEDIFQVTKSMIGLRAIRFDPPTHLTPTILEGLRHRQLHIILDCRNSTTSFHALINAIPWLSIFTQAQWWWSIAQGSRLSGIELASILPAAKLKALCCNHTINARRGQGTSLLSRLQDCASLEELQLYSRKLDFVEFAKDHLPQSARICGAIAAISSLRRLRIDGVTLCRDMIDVLPQLRELEHLSIYSRFRATFHKGCDSEDTPTEPTVSMSWLELPKLKTLDLRFLCGHFKVEQIVPKGLTGLRVEFYGAHEGFTARDLDWLSCHSPLLERLELDIGELDDIFEDTEDLKDRSLACNETRELFRCLQHFGRLRTLRLCPTYWRDGKMQRIPMLNRDRVVHIFWRLRNSCPSLQMLIVCISWGEYPVDIVPRMGVSQRPMKLTVKDIGVEGQVALRCGYACVAEVEQQLYQDCESIGDSTIVPVPGREFFDDLENSWTFRQYEIEDFDSVSWETLRQREDETWQ